MMNQNISFYALFLDMKHGNSMNFGHVM